MPRVTVKGKKYRFVKIKNPKKLPLGSAILIPSKGVSKMSRKKRVGRPRKRKRLPPRIKTGKHKGEFRKRKKRR